jgi:hypothetical protein
VVNVAWLWDLSADTLALDFTIDDIMEDLEFGWPSADAGDARDPGPDEQ